MSVTFTQSEQLRKQGNELFLGSRREGLAPIVRRTKLQKAICCYNSAMQSATSSDQRASAAKNLAKAAWEVTLHIENTPRSFDDYCHYFKETTSNLKIALQTGTTCKDQLWIDQLKTFQVSCVSSAIVSASSYPLEMRLGAMETFAQLMEVKDHICMCFLEMATVLFQNSVRAIEKDDFKTSLHSLKECYRPIEEMKRHGKDNPVYESEARILEDDVNLHTASAESLQAIVTGDQLLQVAVLDSEDLKISMVMEVLDWYTKAVVLARDIEIEREAVASSRIGKVYDQVLKMPCKARRYFKHSIELAHSLTPKSFITQDWFNLARENLEKYQRESLVEQQKRDDEERLTHLKNYKKQLKQIRDITDKYTDQSKHYLVLVEIYKAFPPKNPSFKLSTEAEMKTMGQTDLKKVFLKACIHYHPDKQNVSKYGIGWKYFAAEITKVFTNIYSHYKCMS